jgi:ABC-type molybdenum transport system ATPase subunit/photorepair protein PhrA
MISLKSVEYNYNDTLFLSFKDWLIQQGEHWLILGIQAVAKQPYCIS